MKLRLRNHSTPHAHAESVVRIMRPQILNAWFACLHHYKRRHSNGSTAARAWAKEVCRIDRDSGYAQALTQMPKE